MMDMTSRVGQSIAPRGGMTALTGAVVLAAIIWFFLFAVPGTPFWVVIAAATFVLGGSTLYVYPDTLRDSGRRWLLHLLRGIAAAAILYVVFYVGNEFVRVLLPTGGEQVANVYATKAQASPRTIGLLLLLIIGPGEELFWRGWVQRGLMRRLGRGRGFVVATLLYIVIHVPSLNLTLVGAAAVAGIFWGLMYLKYDHIGPGLISHALWDVAVFVLFPFA